MLRILLAVGLTSWSCLIAHAQSTSEAVLLLENSVTSSDPAYRLTDADASHAAFHVDGRGHLNFSARQEAPCKFLLSVSSDTHEVEAYLDFTNAVWSDVTDDGVLMSVPGASFCLKQSRNAHLFAYKLKDGDCVSPAKFALTSIVKKRGAAAVEILKKSCPGRAF